MLISLVFSAVAMAAAGDPDPTFSGDGKQRTNFGSRPDGATAAARQADGKIVAVGHAGGNFLVARYNVNGLLDPSFSGDGSVQTTFTGTDAARDVALQGNKIVVAGFSRNNEGTTRFALARYRPNGSLDPSFSGDGKQTTDFGGFDRADAVALQGDGKIVAVGRGGPGAALVRYNPNGSLDTSFSGDGKKTTTILAPNGVALQGDGKIIAVGFASGTSNGDFALARFNPDGSLDPSFSGDGKQTTDFGVGSEGNDVAIQGDGKIVTVGFAGNNTASSDSDFALARYNPNGSLDPSFSGDGLQTTDFLFEGTDAANDVAIQANGRIIAVGLASGGATGFDFGLARYNTNGSLDTTFSADGLKRTDFGGNFGCCDRANSVVLQGDGRLVAIGIGIGEFGLARYLGG